MRPLQSVAMGLLIVALTARFQGYDALPDFVGWVLVVLGVRRLGLSDLLTGLVGATLAVSIVVWWPPVQDALGELHPSLWWTVTLPQLAACALLCRELAVRATASADRPAAAWLRTATVLVGVSAVAPVAAFSADSSDDVLAAVYAAAAGVVLLIIVLLFSYASRPWAVTGDEADAVVTRTGGS